LNKGIAIIGEEPEMNGWHQFHYLKFGLHGNL
jgi:hypothetical protein